MIIELVERESEVVLFLLGVRVFPCPLTQVLSRHRRTSSSSSLYCYWVYYFVIIVHHLRIRVSSIIVILSLPRLLCNPIQVLLARLANLPQPDFRARTLSSTPLPSFSLLLSTTFRIKNKRNGSTPVYD